MRRSGDVALVDLGEPLGREAGFTRPAVVVTANRVLEVDPSVVHVVPLTSNVRSHWLSEVVIDADEANGLAARSSAQCAHLRSVAVERLGETWGKVGPVTLAEMREVLGYLTGGQGTSS